MDSCSSNLNLQSPSTESFSYSWLANSFKSTLPLEDSWFDETSSSFIEMDPRLPPSKRFIRVSSDFGGFDFPVSDSPLGLVDADELISNGFVVPLFVRDMKMDDHYASSSGDAMSTSTNKSARWSGRVSLRRCRRVLSKRLFCKYFLKFLLRPLFYRSWRRGCQFERSSSGNTKTTVAGRKWEFSAATSPRTSVAYSTDDNWRRSCDSDSSIYEAVLHCKKTQGK